MAPYFMMRSLSLILVLFLTACSSSSFTSYLPEPYKVPVQQGNVITQEMVSKLKPGMTKAQVRFVMGTPPITDRFHADRWDYVYSMKDKGKEKEHRTLTLFFENDALTRVAGDVAAATKEDKAAEAAKPAKASQEIVLEKFDPNAPVKPPEDEKGFLGRMLEAVGL